MINSKLPEYIRNVVRDKREANEEIQAQLDEEGWTGFPRFLASLFFLAVDRRFGETASRTEVIRFVAELRSGLADDGLDISADDAENLILANIDPEHDYNIDPSMIGKIQAAAIYKIFTDEHIGDADLDALLSEAVTLASRA